MVEPYLNASMLWKAQQQKAAQFEIVNLRDFGIGPRKQVDDTPYGGGDGMVLKPEPIVECVEWLAREHGPFQRLALCPSGTPFVQERAERLALEERVLLLCGRYEGFDERVFDELEFERVSLGDYVLSGGELGALAVCEAAVRLIPGVRGDERSAAEDSFRESIGRGALDHPHYTRPETFRGHAVPDVLRGGNHAAIEAWRAQAAARKTRARQP